MRARARLALRLVITISVLWIATLAPRPGRAQATPLDTSPRFEDTAYGLRPGQFSLGLWSAEAGVFDGVTIGTYLPSWFAFPLVDSPILTGFIKVQAPFQGPVALSLRVGAAYFDASELASRISNGRATRADMLAIPFELAASVRVSERATQSLALHYVAFEVGASEQDEASGGGSARATHASLSALFELQVTPMLALTMTGRLSVFQSVATIRAHVQDGATELTAELGFRPYDGKLPWALVPGVAFTWSRVKLELGVGYGSYWLPLVQAPLPGTSIVPEGNVYVRF